MWYPAVVVTPPAAEPVTLAQARRQCNVPDSDVSRDDDIRRLISAERGFVERYCGIRVPTQTVAAKCDAFCDFAAVPVVPVQSVVSIAYVDTAGAVQTLPASAYELRADDLTVSIVPAPEQRWPIIRPSSRITLTVVAGYAAVPAELASAILLRIASDFSLARDLYLKREEIEDVMVREWVVSDAATAVRNTAVEALLANFRVYAL